MFRLALILHVFIGSTLMGAAIIAALALGMTTLQPILVAAAIGFVAAVPVSWLIAKQLYGAQ